MAIRPEDEYGSRAVPADADYPHGSAQNETVEGANDGTPYLARWRNDVWGFLQWLLTQAGVTPSGNPDTVLASDYGDALLALQPKSVWWGAAQQQDLDTITNLNGTAVALSSDTVAVFTGASPANNLATYVYSAGAWTIDGAAGPNISSGVGVSVTALASVAGKPRVAVFNCATQQLGTYEFTSGVGWAQVGNLLVVNIGATSYNFAGFAALDGARVVLVASDRTAVFDFDGADWAQAGNTFTPGASVSVPSCCSLSPSVFAVADRSGKSMQAYSFDGTDIVAKGASVIISGGAGLLTPEVCALNDTDVLVLDNDPASGADAELSVYRLANTQWSKPSNTATLSGGNYNGNSLSAISGTRFLFTDVFNDDIYLFDLPFTFGPLNTAAGGAF